MAGITFQSWQKKRTRSLGDLWQSYRRGTKYQCPCEMSGQEMPQWALVDRNGVPHKLKHSMVFLGRDECDISLQSRSVDKRHAVITFDHYSKKFKIKDLSSLNGTYVNESRIPEQTYVALENLDTIRFGYDPMVFRIEETDGTGEHMSPDRPPAWASKEVSPMAECQGCIVEQDIKHTCGGNPELGDTTDEKHDPVPHTCNGHGTYNRWQMRRRRSHDYATAFTNGVYGNGLRCSKSQEKVYENSYVSTRTSANPSASFHPNYSRSETNLRAMQQRSPVIPYSTGESRTMSGSITPGNESRSRYLYGGLSYTQSVPSLERIAHPGFSITQEIDYGEGKDPAQSDGTSTTFQARLDHRRSLTGEEELATVKKGTPLYGQPSWWGEDDQWSDDKAKTDHNQNSGQARDKQARDREERVMNGDNNSHHDRPASLPLEQNNNKASNGVKYQTQEKYKHVYMDIPIRDSPTEKSLPPERDKMASTEKVSAEEIVTDKEKLDRSSSSAVAFSVEFSDSEETKSPKISMSESLSKFLPHKVRRSLREKREKKEEREKELREKEQTLKEQEVISPTRQKKLDDLWGSPMEKGKHSKSIRQSTGYTSEGHSQPSDHEQEISIKSDTAVTRGKKPPQQPPGQTRTPGERKPSSRATGGSTKKATAQSQQQSPGVQGSPKQGSGNRDKTKDSAALSASQSSSSSSFLIEKMFESTSRPGARDPRGRDPGGRDPGAEEPTEYALYKEAQSYDTQEGKARSATLPRPRRSPKDSSSQMKKSQSFDQNDLQLQDMETNSPVGDDNKNDSDSVSEAGTYTIEGDEKSKEEEAISRENIDKVFNVGDSSVILIQRPVIENGVNEKDECQGLDLERQEGEGQVEDLDTLEKEIEELERERANLGVANSMEAEIGSTAQTDKLFSGKPRWVQEWSARKGNSVDSSKETEDDDTFDADSLTAKQPPAVSSRKRIGTGRKLPTPPTPRGSSGEPSPRISGHTSRDGKDISRSEPSTLKRVTANGGSGGMKTSRSEVSEIFASEGRRVTPERTPVERKGRRQQPDYEDSKSTMSIDTEVLLRDTAHVMAAMQARVRKGQQKQSGDEGSDSDSSTHVMVNGANGANRQPASKSATEQHTPGSKTVSGASPYRGSRQSFPVKTSSPPPSQKPTQSLWRKGPYNPPKGEPPAASVVSDLLSESESRSARSDDASTDISEESPMLSRKTSKGKGAITATRPNRAFQLRRARTETESDTSRSEVSAASSRATSAKTGSAKTIRLDRGLPLGEVRLA
ncbi:centrosomal protein of 170 kDa protein B isoform X1 [Lingula anatina]|uniref:Centrosomal protein of 170 kDa protein B isoform X1 n=2 Tax=Lingula anatina TaxID=7574 RepID=A0A1S3KCL3_LINAN|nr:centrosomal protein of 170 kDa protein B isoform X1 [Lingula anatina]|eukprot:XP_013420179.1 centrosomal protein of 170 kDa protein B isoform X1 [Lingula anatina]